MLTHLLLVSAVCCAFSYGAVFDPYSRRYGVHKDTMDTMMEVPAGSSSNKFISGMYALSSKAAMNSTQNATYSAWIQKMDTEICKDTSKSTKEKWTLIAASMEEFNATDSFTYSKIQSLNISTWGPVDSVVKITTEWNLQSSLELVVPTSTKGNCKLFDLLLSASSGDSEKHQALSEFIESDLKVIIADKSKKQKDLIKAINKALKEKFFVGTRASWKSYFARLKLNGFYSFGQWDDAAMTFERQSSVEVTLTGSGVNDCPFIKSLNATLSSTTFTLTQKSFIKQLMNYFIQQWSTETTVQGRMKIISMKFSESIDLSYSWFGCLNSIDIQGFGKFWDLIIISCQIERIPESCGCPIPTLSDETTTEMMMTTEMTTEMSTEGTTEMSTSGSTWDSTFSSITFPSTTEGCTCTCEM